MNNLWYEETCTITLYLYISEFWGKNKRTQVNHYYNGGWYVVMISKKFVQLLLWFSPIIIHDF